MQWDLKSPADTQEPLISRSAEATEAHGEALAGCLPDNVLLALSGDLGVGKTTLVRGLARGLGISEGVTSPTYQLYAIHQGRRQLLHLDAYRLQGDADLDSLYLDDLLRPPFIIAVEWPERVPQLLADYPCYHLRMSQQGREHRMQWIELPSPLV